MNRINILKTLLVVALLNSCSRSEEPEVELLTSGTAISFNTEELSADWGTKASTRGVAVDNENLTTQASTIMVYAFMSTPESYVTACYIENLAATYSVAYDGYWSFTPAQYYLMHKSLALDFLAYTPQPHYESDSSNNGISQSLTDFDNKEITISYSVPTTGRNQPDLMLATPQTGRYEAIPLDELELNHVLTQVSMSACVGNNTDTDRYKITRFTMHDITIAGSLTYSVDGGIGEWVESYNGSGDFITSAMLPDEDLGETPVLLTTTMTSIMTNGHTLFMIPQEIEDKSGTAPTIQITITDTWPTTEYVENASSSGDYNYDDDTGGYILIEGKTGTHDKTDTYLVYRTDKLTLPSPDGDDADEIGDGWLQGQHVNLQFEFEVDENQLVIPLSFTAKLMNWIEVDVDKEIDSSIYVYLNVDSIAADTETTVTLYTNGVVTGVDGVGTAYSKNTDNSYTVTISGPGELKVYIENSDETTITKNFTITVTESESEN